MGIEYLLAAAQLIEEQEASTFNYKLTMYITKNYIMDVLSPSTYEIPQIYSM